MKLNGRKLQKWRTRLGIKQLDMAHWLCVDQRELQRVENHQLVPNANYIRGLLQDALTYFQDTPIHDLHVDAVKRNLNTKGCTAMVQVMTKVETTTDPFWIRENERARALMRIVDSLRFEKGGLPNETLLLVKFEEGSHLQIVANPMRVVQHVETYYVQGRRVVSVERKADAA